MAHATICSSDLEELLPLVLLLCKKKFLNLSFPQVYTRQLETIAMVINTQVNFLMVNSTAKESTPMLMATNMRANLSMVNSLAKERSLVVMAGSLREVLKIKFRLNTRSDVTDFVKAAGV